MSSNQWQDRRGMFQKGKELHEPTTSGKKFAETGSVTNAVRRASTSSTGSGSGERTGSTGGGSFPTAGRRSSAASGGGMFSNLTNVKRGSQDYGDRRTSQGEMMGSGGGVVSGWFNSTFKGMQKPADNQKDQKRGVME